MMGGNNRYEEIHVEIHLRQVLKMQRIRFKLIAIKNYIKIHILWTPILTINKFLFLLSIFKYLHTPMYIMHLMQHRYALREKKYIYLILIFWGGV